MIVTAARKLIAPLLLVLLVGAAFGPALRGGFIWDDGTLIENNPYLRDFAHLGRNLSRAFWDVHEEAANPALGGRANVYYRPLVTLSLMVDYQLHGQDPRGYHLTNLVLHALVVLLALLVALRLLSGRTWLAALAAAAFAVHPTRAEAVCWISGRTDLMMSLFALLALLLFWRGLQAAAPVSSPTPRQAGRSPRRIRGLVCLAGGWVCTVAAVLCKEGAVALALVVPALDLLVINPDHREQFARNFRRSHVPLLLLSVAFVLARLWWQSSLLGDRGELGLLPRLNLVLSSLAHYGAMTVDPYQPNPMVGAFFNPFDLSAAGIAGGALVLVLASGGLLLALRRAPKVAWALVLFGATLAPATNLVPLRLMTLVAERFYYLPWLGLALALALGIGAASTRLRLVLIPATVLLLATWAMASWMRAGDYRSPRLFWSAAVAADPENPLAHQELAVPLMQARRFRAAERHLRAAFAGYKRAGKHDGMLGTQLRLLDLALDRSTDHQRPRIEAAVKFYRRLLALAQRPPGPGQLATARVGALELRVVVGDAQARAGVRSLRGSIQMGLGVALGRLGRDAEAITALRRARELDPKNIGALLSLALAEGRALRFDRALDTLRRLEALHPGLPAAGELRGALGGAAARFAPLRRRGYRAGQDPADPLVHRTLAEICILLKAPLRAVHHLRRAIGLRPDDRQLRTMLALELASSGELDGALAAVADARRRFGSEPGITRLEANVRQVFEERSAWRRGSSAVGSSGQ